MPTTLLGTVDVVDTGGSLWRLSGNAPVPDERNEILTASPRALPSGAAGPVLIYLDLLAQPSDGAFHALASECGGRFGAAYQIRTVSGGSLKPEEAAALVGEASQLIRRLAGQQGTSDVHLLLRCPWTIALLIGRALNTLRVHLYEWEDGATDAGNVGEPRYLPSLVVRSGAGGSPIESVSLPVRTQAHPLETRR